MYKRAIYGHKQGNYKLLKLWCQLYVYITSDFEVLLTMHLSIILATEQLNAQILVSLIKLIIFLYMFWALLCPSSGGQMYYTASGIVTLSRWPSGVQVCTGWPPTEGDDTRCCIMQFDLLMLGTKVLETIRICALSWSIVNIILILKSDNFKYLYLNTECIIPIVKD